MVYYSQGCSLNCLSGRLAGQTTSLLLDKDLKREKANEMQNNRKEAPQTPSITMTLYSQIHNKDCMLD